MRGTSPGRAAGHGSAPAVRSVAVTTEAVRARPPERRVRATGVRSHARSKVTSETRFSHPRARAGGRPIDRLVGRVPELEAIDDAVASVAQGARRGLAIVGEPGI